MLKESADQLEAIGLVEVARAAAGHAGVAVLPDDPATGATDQHDPMVPIVGGRNDSARQRHGERGTVEHARSGGWSIAPGDAPLLGDFVDAAGRVEAGDEQVLVRQQLRVGGIAGGRANRVDELPGTVEAVYPAAN